MPHVPDNPNVAQIWLDGEAPNQQLSIYVPRGDKGDPGGFTAGTDLGASDLNTITTPGLYRQGASANVTLGNNYPLSGANGTGVLEVIQQGASPASGVLQRYSPVWGNQTGKVFFVRTYSNSAWSTWVAQVSNRVDQAAGRVIYAWDYINAREQIIYGDTGWRTVAVTPVAGKVLSGSVRYRRRGDRVELAFVDVLLDPANNGFCEIILSNEVPVGFRPHALHRGLQAVGLQNNALNHQWITNYGTIGWVHTINSGVYSVVRPTSTLMGSITWTTDEAWPTTLPGTAFGSIPNV